MIGLGLRLGMGRGGAGGGGPVAPVISGQAYDEPTDTITASVDQTGCTPYWLFNQSATPLAGPFVVANATGTDDPTASGVNYYTAVEGVLPSGTNYLWFTVMNGSGQIATPVSVAFTITVPVAVSEVREVKGFAGSYTLAVGPSDPGDEIFICAQHQSGNTVSSANFDLIHTAIRNTQAYSILRWNGTGSRPNNTNITVTSSTTNNGCYASVVVKDCFVAASSFASNSGSGSVHYLPALTSANGLLLALFSSNNETGNYTIASPGPPTVLTVPISTDFEDGQFLSRLSATFGFRVAAIQHTGPTTPVVSITATGGNCGYVILALETSP